MMVSMLHWVYVLLWVYVKYSLCELQLVSMGMKNHEQSLHVQLVATACVFNLTTQDKTLGMPLELLRITVHQLLTAMRNFPNHEQVPLHT